MMSITPAIAFAKTGMDICLRAEFIKCGQKPAETLHEFVAISLKWAHTKGTDMLLLLLSACAHMNLSLIHI